jgi:hypothetical protein
MRAYGRAGMLTRPRDPRGRPDPRKLRRYTTGTAGFMANVGGVPLLDGVPAFYALYPNARLIVEFAWGADVSADPTTWNFVDVSNDVLQADGRRIDITPFGRSDGALRTQPAGCRFALQNTSGAYSLGPQSSNYPNVKLNVPVRVSVNLTGYPNDTSVRFQGGAWSMKPSWDETGDYAIVEVAAAGVMRRLGAPLPGTSLPPLTRAVFGSTGTTPVEYWAMNDGTAATRFGSAASGGHPMTISGSPELASVGGFDGDASSSFANIVSASAYLGGALAEFTTLHGGSSWTVEGWFQATKTSVADAQAVVCFWHTDGGVYGALDWYVYVARIGSSEGLVLTVDHTTLAATALSYSGSSVSMMDGEWHQFRVTAKQNSGSVTIEWYVDGVLRDSDPNNATRPTVGNINDFGIGDPGLPSGVLTLTNTASLSVAHVGVYATSSATDHFEAGTGYSGETATERLARVCADGDIPLFVYGTSSVTMGPQGSGTLLDVLRECEGADLGTLGDGRGPGVYYVTRSARYDQAVSLAFDRRDLQGLQPDNDDQSIANQATVNRTNGSSATYEDSTGPLGTRAIGVYPYTPPGSLNLDSDSPLANIAAWLVHLRTVVGYRYPLVPFDLRRVPSFAPAWLAMRPAARLQVSSVASWAAQHPAETVDLLAEGWSESLSRFVWEVGVNGSPAAPWQVAVLEGAGGLTAPKLRWDSTVSSLAADVTSADTSLSVASTGQLWTTTATFPADFPFDVEIVSTGEQVTVGAIVGAASPQTFTVTRSVNGVVEPAPAGSQVRLWRPATLAL